ncbi:thioredoxin TrxA [Tepidimicrobium xylanilyticum]|uniref:Thioredoxin n=1 Tax=Tepidimicrobium xylanilyticum TaxID=1123352 RepID=A0A1H2ZYD4_9FIRM|nr:thioredoxin domain-containing protein [Tepidimicrobium xylanilyticum]GMG96365.1 thioredoxin [Tepidimicrobium xylanilyticum]SDX22552.1 thioredoxin 1 [Tepidimicrobium xylanilyticum]
MVELTRDNFEEEVLKAEGPVLVDYWGPTCEPCKALMPHIEEMAEKYGDKVKFCSLDITKARRLAIKQKVMGLPAIVIYKDGEEVERLAEAEATATAVEEMVKKYV